ncbi:MAG: small-conductance mechanosensitive channel [Bacteriovoracaceae bacterium]|jgi:small-conductance mechanosensitive channel
MEIDSILVKVSELWALLKTPLFSIEGANISLTNMLLSIFIIISCIFIGKKLSKVTKFFLDSKGADSGVSDSISKFVRIIIVLIGVLLAIKTLGFSLQSLAALSAVLMVGIGFGLQNIAQNFISGLILLVERPIKVGDIIQIGSTTGRVLEIRVRSTIVQTRDDISIIVPNSKLISEEVTNESFSGSNIRLSITVGVAYGSDLELVKKILKKAADGHPEKLEFPKSDVIFKSFGDSSLDFELRFWTKQIWEQRRMRSDIRFEIAKLFEENNIQIPFPQRDLHIKRGPDEAAHKNDFL